MGISGRGNYRLCCWCSRPHSRTDRATALISAGCGFTASHLSLKYFAISITRQNKAILKLLLDTGSIAKSSRYCGGRERWEKGASPNPLWNECSYHTPHPTPQPSTCWELSGAFCNCAPNAFCFVCNSNCIKSARKRTSFFFLSKSKHHVS